MSSERARAEAERLADLLMQVAGDQNVRALEAVAAALANRRRAVPESGGEPDRPASGSGLAEGAAGFRGERFELCRRIARRALRGSLGGLVAGADAFHRIDASPPWARRLLPVAVFGSFLFYRTPDAAADPPPSVHGEDYVREAGSRRQVERVLDVRGRRADPGRQ